MSVADLGPLAVAVPVVVACLALAAGRHVPRVVVDIVGVLTAAAVTALTAVLVAVTASGPVVSWLGGWRPSGGTGVGIVLVADRMGAGAAALAAALTTVALVYSWRYFEAVDAHYHALLLLFMTGMVGFALSGDLFDMFVFFELMGVAAYVLTGYKVEDATAVQGGLNFAMTNSLGAYVTLMGIGLLYARTGELGLAQLSTRLAGHRADALVTVAFVLVVTGFLVKAAMVPFHFWLDDAHAVAPTPVCLLFSGVMVELGAYAVLRTYWVAFDGVLPGPDLRRLLVVLGVLTAVVGAVMSFVQRHLKRLLAYSTIAHTGLFVLAAATLDADGTAGGALYVVGHAGVKGALFLGAGMLLNRYGTVDELELHGRARESRLLGLLTALGGLALAGLPPFGTALGKAVSEEALASAGLAWAPALFVVVSAVTGAAVLRAAGRIFLGLGPAPERGEADDETSGDEEEPETPALPKGQWVMMSSIAAILAGAVLLGAVPGLREGVAVAAAQLVDGAGYVTATLRGEVHPLGALPPVHWTASGLALSAASCLLAAGLAAAALWAPSAVRRALDRATGPAVRTLRRVHSGHIGDYVAWLFLGVAAVGALAGLPLLV